MSAWSYNKTNRCISIDNSAVWTTIKPLHVTVGNEFLHVFYMSSHISYDNVGVIWTTIHLPIGDCVSTEVTIREQLSMLKEDFTQIPEVMLTN